MKLPKLRKQEQPEPAGRQMRRERAQGSRFYRGTMLRDPARQQQLEDQRAETASLQRTQADRQRRSQRTRFLLRGTAMLVVLFLASRLFIGGIRAADPAAEQAYGATAQAYLSHHWWQHFRPLFDEDGFARALTTAHPALARPEIKLPWWSRTVTYTAFERAPLAVWQRSRTESWLIDRSAAAYRRLESDPPEGLVRIVDSQQLPVTPGVPLLPGSTITTVRALLDRTEKYDVRIDRLIIPAAPREVHLQPIGDDYIVKFSTERGAGDQLKELAAIRRHLKARNRTPNDYIDVRIADRAYYR